MDTIRAKYDAVSKYFDLTFFIKFIILLLLLHFFNFFYIGLTVADGRIYSAFLDHYLNYVSWIKDALLHSSNLVAHAFGLNSYVADWQTLRIVNGPRIKVLDPCLGLEIMFFWIAFINAHANFWMKKAYWTLGGILLIWVINSVRIALILLAVVKGWNPSKYLDHHTLFNLLAYALIGLLMYLFSRNSKIEENKTTAIVMS